MPSLEAALREMRLSPSAEGNITARIRRRRDEVPENIAAGPVMIPRFDTLKELSEHASTLHLSSAAPTAGIGDTKPFPVLTPEDPEAIWLPERTVTTVHRLAMKNTGDTGSRDSVSPSPGWGASGTSGRRALLVRRAPG